MSETPPSRRQHAEDRRNQILDAALRVFSEKGYDGASIRDIAREVGVTEGLLYHYFESKEQLMHACWKERSWRAQVERILANAGNTPVEDVLRDLISEFLLTLYQNGPMVRMFAAEMQRNEEMASCHVARIGETQSLIHDFLRERRAAGELRPEADVETAPGLLMGCAYSLFLMWGRVGPEEWKRMASDLAQNGVQVVMHGIAQSQTND